MAKKADQRRRALSATDLRSVSSEPERRDAVAASTPSLDVVRERQQHSPLAFVMARRSARPTLRDLAADTPSRFVLSTVADIPESPLLTAGTQFDPAYQKTQPLLALSGHRPRPVATSGIPLQRGCIGCAHRINLAQPNSLARVLSEIETRYRELRGPVTNAESRRRPASLLPM